MMAGPKVALLPFPFHPPGSATAPPPEAIRRLHSEILPFLPESIRRIIAELPEDIAEVLEEIRLRLGRPLMIVGGSGDLLLRPDGAVTDAPGVAFNVGTEEFRQAVQLVSQGSLYALEDELKGGYITLPGGHRIGLVGKAVNDRGKLKTLRQISGINYRLARAVPGAADAVLPHLIERSGGIYSTLLVSPPRCGKTTLLRDLVRQLSDGVPALRLRGHKIGLVDERSEIASCFAGKPQNDVGIRTDILDGCHKAEGMRLLLRSMSPEIIATDEIGHPEDAAAIEEAVNAGVRVIATAHAANPAELKERPSIRPLWNANVFRRIIILGRSRGPGTVEKIIEGDKR
jgi:stage III sporulation protein AA